MSGLTVVLTLLVITFEIKSIYLSVKLEQYKDTVDAYKFDAEMWRKASAIDENLRKTDENTNSKS